jgi:hypothetical protein
MPMMWMDPITETVRLHDTEIWEIYDFTMDAHPIHIHQVQFQVVNRQAFDPMVGDPDEVIEPEPWETGYKDTVIVYPGQLTRVKAKWDIPGLFVWHCHILEHEDNEMMRPYEVVKKPKPGAIRVISDPKGATVILDGVEKGITPIKITDVAPGKHTVVISMEGYHSKQKVVKVESGETTRINVRLKPIKGGKKGAITEMETIEDSEISVTAGTDD